MADIVGYRQWLATLPRQPAFLHNYWCALLAYDMEETKISETFKIPYFILEEELMKEDNNIYLVKGQEPYISAPLRHYLVHLLKPYDENTNVLNVEVILRAFIHNEIDLPAGVFAPLHSSTHFHMIPSECKIWLLYKIRNHKKQPAMPRTVATDALGNAYFIVPGCRLYVRIATSEHIALAIDEETLRGQPWEELYRFVNAQPCLLLSENPEGWDVVRNAFQFFKLNDLIYAIRPDITVRCSAQNLAKMTQSRDRKECQDYMTGLDPIPPTLLWQTPLSRTQLKRLNMMNNAMPPANLNDINQNVAAMNLNENTPANKPEIKPRQKTSNQINGKCWNFPQCPLKHICKYVHPRIPCSKFPNCPRGWECLFLHEFCPNDADCVEPNCPYEHVMSKPTYYRMTRDPEPEVCTFSSPKLPCSLTFQKPRPVASIQPTIRAETVAQSPTSLPSPVSEQLYSHSEAKKRCAYFPKCTKIHKSDFFHPTEPCRNLAAGQMCAGLFCLFIHGPCPNDDSCTSMTCIYEHYKSPLVIERRLEMRNKKGQTLSRAPSMSNLSTCSKRSRRSVTFDLDSDGDSVVSNKKQDTTSQKPKSILKTTPQRDKCPAFPQCPNGGLCIFTHDLCKNDGGCSKEDCDYNHLLPHPIANSWCKNGSRCTLIGCSELHPKECTGSCPTPGNCWMYHRIAAAAAAAAPPPAPPIPRTPPTPAPRTTAPRPQTLGPGREPQGTGHGTERHDLGSQSTRPHVMGPQGMGPQRFPGYGHAFPYGHPAGYGYGQPNYGYGPGYAPGYWQHPGYGGYGPGMPYGPQYGPGPGPRGDFPAPVPGFGPPTPPPHRQYSASESPPPIYGEMSEQGRKMFERKQELGESTRL